MKAPPLTNEQIIADYKWWEANGEHNCSTISTKIVNRYFSYEDMTGDEEFYQTVFDVFRICRDYVNDQYGIHTVYTG